LVTSGTSVPFGLTSEIASDEVSGVEIRKETRTNDTGPRCGTVSDFANEAPIGRLMFPVEYVFVAARAGATPINRTARSRTRPFIAARYPR
jgi:hypothetical protein